MKKTFTKVSLSLLMGGMVFGANAAEPIFFQDFENGLGDCEIYGDGELKDLGGEFGTVFANAMGGMRTNFLKLPSSAFDGLTTEITLMTWVNRGPQIENYFFCPMFACYATYNGVDNGMPMWVTDTRGAGLQINTNGPDNVGDNWCDFTDVQNLAGENFASTAWLDDDQWHLFAVTLTPTSGTVYVDGEVLDAWVTTGEGPGNTINVWEIPTEYICVGGNQAWNWGDPDPGFYFDNIAVYDVALTADELKAMYEGTGVESIKAAETGVENIYNMQGVKVSREDMGNGLYIINGKKVMVRK